MSEYVDSALFIHSEAGEIYLDANGKTERPVFIIKIEGSKLKMVVKIY